MKQSARRVAVIGGSTVYGQGDSERGGFVGRFREAFESRSEHYRVFNLGVDGDTAELMLARAPTEARARRVDLIFCYLGLNDIIRPGSPTASHSDLGMFKMRAEALIRELLKIAPTIVMTAVPLDQERTQPFRGKLYFLEADAQLITEITRETARELGVPCLDIFAAWSERADRKELLADGLHANAKGHALIAEQLIEFVNQNSL